MKREHIFPAWLTGGICLGVLVNTVWMIGLASGLGVPFEISMLFEELPLFLGGGCLVGFAGFGIHAGILRGRDRLKTRRGIEQKNAGYLSHSRQNPDS